MNVGINGFGRIGKLIYMILIERGYKVPLINDPGVDPKSAVYTLSHDSVHRKGKFTGKESDIKTIDENTFKYKTQTTKITKFYEPKEIPWDAHKVDFVIEASGFFLTLDACQGHIGNSNRRVIITAPSKDAPMFVYGVNHLEMTPDMKIVSNASCTTNCLAPLAKIIHDEFKIKEAIMTTVHSVTSTQKTVDSLGKSLGLGRSGSNIIPSTTGAAQAVGKVIPSLLGKLTGMAIRVPTTNVSMVDLVVKFENPTSLEEIFEKIKNSSISNIITTTEEDLVSADFIGCEFSTVVAEKACIQLNNTFFKLIAWYDNEWGYSTRVVDLLGHMST